MRIRRIPLEKKLTQGANRSKETRQFENKEQTARKRLKILRTISKRLREFSNKEHNARTKKLGILKRRSKPLEEDRKKLQRN